MKILTLNTWQKSGPWEQRWKIILQGLNEYDPDIVAFQELFDADWRDQVARHARYPHFATPDPSASGLVILSRFPVGRSELYTMKSQSPFEDYRRYVLWAEVAWGGGMLHLFDTHLSWKPEDQATRQAQVREAWDWIRARPVGGEMVLMGDMNSTPDSAEIRWLLRESTLVDTFGRLHPDEPGYTWDNRNDFAAGHKTRLPDRRIDFIFVRGRVLDSGLKASEVVFTEPGANRMFGSDHFGLLAEFSG